MQLSKQTEKEVLQVYDTWLQSYLHGDVATYDSYFDDAYHFIGSTNNEEFLSRKDTTKFFENTAGQLAGKCDLRKETRTLEQFGGLVFITHVFDAWFLNGADYSYYGRFRFTNILHENKDGWRFIYQHFSTPDSKTDEGETIGFDKVHAENQELREAIKRRTIELEQKNRELEIEAALERVRSRSLAMHKTDELQEVVRVVAEELKNTGVILDTWGAVICTYFQDSKDVLHWTAAEDPANPSIAFLLPYFKDELYDEAWASKNRGDSYFAKVFSYEVKNVFFKHAFEHSDYRQLPDDYKKAILESESHGIAWAWSKNSAIMIPSIQGDLPSDEEKEILIRFAKVFEQSYIRFLDLQIKEVQAQKIREERDRLEKTLHDLKATQKQLIQSEKMASLGELTAGIAHEIQNPMNFVNNFSEVSCELIDEMIEEIEGGDLEEVKAIAHDIQQNLGRILHHGKRADAIVKGMLQHSRQSSSEKAPTDINKLADEYLRLAYHGLRARDKSFNAILETDFDPSLEKIMVVPQDIGRVILNIVTNAFYAVHQKTKANANGYQPLVAIRTQVAEGEVCIAVKDNGNGIPQHIIDKIFQPFFTTKPTGEGTGLGLSLCYDIVKAHDGKLEVETKEGEHTIFKITLPK